MGKKQPKPGDGVKESVVSHMGSVVSHALFFQCETYDNNERTIDYCSTI